MNARMVSALLAVSVLGAVAFAGPQLAPSLAQPILTPPTREPTPDPNKSLPPLPNFDSTYTAPPKDPLSYDDPAMHFRPPDGWIKLPLAPNADANGESEDLKPIAAFALPKGKNDSNIIILSTKSYDGDLDGFESELESSARQGSDTVFFGFKRKISLSNGMPAIFVKINHSAADSAQSSTVYEYLVVDGVRGIVASYSDRAGDPSENDAKAALASLTVVLYPRERR